MSLAVPCERFFFFIFIAKILIEDLFAKIHAYYKNKSSLSYVLFLPDTAHANNAPDYNIIIYFKTK